MSAILFFVFFQAEDGIRDKLVTGVQTCALPISQNLTYTVTVTIHGPSDAAAVVVRDTLPAGVTFVSASNGGSEAAGIVTLPAVPSLANGDSLSRTVTLTAPPTRTLLNTARADPPTPDPHPPHNKR